MNRKDREITEIAGIEDIIKSCKVMRLAMAANGAPYVVPLNFGYEITGSQLTLYFHCAAKGQKTDIIKKNPRICFEMDAEFGYVGQDYQACKYSYRYSSVIGFGQAVEVFGREKDKGLLLLMKNVAGGKDKPYVFDPKTVERTSVYKIVSNDFTAKSTQ